MSRRSLLKTGTAVAAGIAVAPNIIIAGEKTPKKEKKKKVAANDKLNILGVGIGGRGAAHHPEIQTENNNRQTHHHTNTPPHENTRQGF